MCIHCYNPYTLKYAQFIALDAHLCSNTVAEQGSVCFIPARVQSSEVKNKEGKESVHCW